MIVLGIILIVLGFFSLPSLPSLRPSCWTIGIILLIVGLVLMVMGRMGHAVGGRRHYY